MTSQTVDLSKTTNGYAYEMHLHTGEFGWCAKVPAATIVKAYREAGYRGIVTTNHYFNHGFDAMPETTWSGKIDNYLRGTEAALLAVRQTAKDPDQPFDVLLGLELRFEENANDYLIYGVTEEQLIEYPRLYKMNPKSFKKLADELGWFVVQAHPYRKGCEVQPAEYLHGIEVRNENPRHDSRNELALKFANQYELARTAGSDYHQKEDIARAAMVFSRPLRDSADLASCLHGMKKTASLPLPRILTWDGTELESI